MSQHTDSSLLEKLGISGTVARAFQANAITPLLALVALLLGLFAVLVTRQNLCATTMQRRRSA